VRGEKIRLVGFTHASRYLAYVHPITVHNLARDITRCATNTYFAHCSVTGYLPTMSTGEKLGYGPSKGQTWNLVAGQSKRTVLIIR
jgi:hypothetical protein